MPNIDEKVVQMQFDNSEFDPNIKKSQKTFEEFEKTLEFDKGSKALKNFQKDMDKVDTKGLSKQLGKLGESFSALETIAVGALLSVGNRLENFLNKAFRATLTEGATQGWGDYAEKVTAVQTIMAATSSQFKDTATQISVVNGQLDDLRTFADETSFSFKDMTSNIGKFTSQGVNLKTSVRAMEGISTWAALSGASTGEASRAYYNLSQALGTGAVTLIDWKSIENANMATLEFKETALKAAEAAGTLKKQADGTYKTLQGHAVSISNFNQSLSDRWFTSDVLLSSLDVYGKFSKEILEYTNQMDDVSVRQAMRWIDDYAEGTLNLDAVLESVGDDAELVKEMITKLGSEEYNLGRRAFRAAQETKTFAEALAYTKEAIATGWSQTWELIFGDYNEARKFWTDITDDLYEIFVTGGEFRNEVLELWSKTFGRADFVEAVQGLRDAFYAVREVVREAWEAVFPFWHNAKMLATALVNLTRRFKEWAKSLTVYDEATDKMVLAEDVASRLSATVTFIAKALKFAFNIFKSLYLLFAPAIKWGKELIGVLINLVSPLFKSAEALMDNKNALEKFRVLLLGLGALLAAPIKIITIFINKLQNLGNLTLPEFVAKVKNFGINVAKGFVEGFVKAWRAISSVIVTAFSTLVDKIKGVLKIHSPSRVFESIGENTGRGFFRGAKTVWEEGLAKLSTSFASLKEVFNDGTASALKFVAATQAIGQVLLWLIKIAYQVVKAFLKLKLLFTLMNAAINVIRGIGRIATAVPDFIESVGDFFEKKGQAALLTSISTLLLSIAASIAIMAGVFILLSKIKLDDIQQGITIMTAIVSLLIVISVVLLVLGKRFGASAARAIMSISASLIFISVALAIFISILKKIIKIIDSAEGQMGIILKSFGILVLLLGVSIGIMTVLAVLSSKVKMECAKMSRQMIAVAINIGIFFATLLIIAKIFKKVIDNALIIIELLITFLGIVAIFAIVVKAMAKINLAKGVVKLYGAFIALTGLFGILYGLLSIARTMSIGDVIKAGLIMLAAIGVISGIKSLSNAIKGIKSSGILKLIVDFVIISILFKTLASVLILSRLVSINDVINLGIVLATSLVVVAVLKELANFTKGIKSSGILKLIVDFVLMSILFKTLVPVLILSRLVSINDVINLGIVLVLTSSIIVLLKALLNATKSIGSSGILKLVIDVVLIKIFLVALLGAIAISNLIVITDLLRLALVLGVSILVFALIRVIASVTNSIKLSNILKIIVIAAAINIMMKALASALSSIANISNLNDALKNIHKILFILTAMVVVFTLLAILIDATGVGFAGVLLISFMLVSIVTSLAIFASVIPSLVSGLYIFAQWLEDFGKQAAKMVLYALAFSVFSAFLLIGSALISVAFVILALAVGAFAVIAILFSAAMAIFTGTAILLSDNSEKIQNAINVIITAFTQPGMWKAIGRMAVFGLAGILLGAGSLVLAAGFITLSLALFLFNLALPIFEKFIIFMNEFINWDLVGKAGQFLLFAVLFSIACAALIIAPIVITAIAISLVALGLAMMFISAHLDAIINGFSLFTKITSDMVAGMALLSLGLALLSIGLFAIVLPLSIVISVVTGLVRAAALLANAIASLIDAIIRFSNHINNIMDSLTQLREKVNVISEIILKFGKTLGDISPYISGFGKAINEVGKGLIVLSIGVLLTSVSILVLAIVGLVFVGVLFLFVLLLDRIKADHPRLYESIMDIADAIAKMVQKEADLLDESYTLSKGLGDICKVLINLVGDIGDAVGSVITGIGDLVGGALTGLGNLFSGKNKEYKRLKELAQAQTDLANAQARLAEANTAFNESLKELGPKLDGYLGSLSKSTGVFEQLGIIAKSYRSDIRRLGEDAKFLYSQLAKDTIDGYLDALIEGNARLKAQADHMVTLILNTMKKGLDIHSPSREMFEIGSDTVEGFDEGAEDYWDIAMQKWKERLKTIRESTEKTVKHIKDAWDDADLRAKQAEFDALETRMRTKNDLTREDWNRYFALQNELTIATNKRIKEQKEEQKESATLKETLGNVGSDMKTIIEKVKSGEMTLKEGLSAAWSSLKTNFGGFLGDKFGDLKEWLLGDGGILSGFKGMFDGIMDGDLFKGMDLEEYLPKIEENTEDIYDSMNTSDLTGTVDPMSSVSGTGGNTINTYEFVQNNYSPKALSRIELYRQTNRQFNNFRTREVLAR